MTSSLVRLSQQPEYKSDEYVLNYFHYVMLSLFRRLMVQLKNNHRSHAFIVELVSHMFYDNTLLSTQPKDHDSLCATEILDFESVSIF